MQKLPQQSTEMTTQKILNSLRAEIDQAEEWLSRASDAVSEQLQDESYSDGTRNPGAYQLQQDMEDHLNGLVRHFDRLVLAEAGIKELGES